MSRRNEVSDTYDDHSLPPIRRKRVRQEAINMDSYDDLFLPPMRERRVRQEVANRDSIQTAYQSMPLVQGPEVAQPATRNEVSISSTMSGLSESSDNAFLDEEDFLDDKSKRRKRNPHPNAVYYETEVLPLLRKAQRSYARHYLSKFNNKDIEKVITPLWANSRSSQKDWEISEARHRCLENAKSWKCKSLKAMKEHVAEEIKISESQSTNGLHLGTTKEAPDIMEYFLRSYRPEKFIQVFQFTGSFLSIGTTTKWGLWYLKHIYANLATQVKIYLDIAQKKPQEEAGAWIDVLDFWDQMATDKTAGQLTEAKPEYFGVKLDVEKRVVKRVRKSLDNRIFFGDEEIPPLPGTLN